MNNNGMLRVCVHSTMYSCLFMVSLILISCGHGQAQHFDTITLILQDFTEYNCTLSKSQIKKSLFLTEIFDEFDKGDDKKIFNTSTLIDGVATCPLPYDADKEFFKIGFNDMCNYLQNYNIFNQDLDYHDHEYSLPMPLLLNNSSNFYHDVKQLTNQEIQFMKEIESFDDSNKNDNPFDINMTRIDSLFKIAEFLQMERLLTIIAARQASLMTNMNKNKMIQWLVNNDNLKKQMIHSNNNNDHQCIKNNDNERMIPLFSQTLSFNNYDHDNNDDNEQCTRNINKVNEITKYNWVLLSQMLPFFSCFDIHTFSSISVEFYNFANEWGNMNRNIDPMVKVLTNNNDATCLSLTKQELLFYKPFLTLPQYKWSENQNNTYNHLKTMTDTIIYINDDFENGFDFDTIISFGEMYDLNTLQCTINSDDDSIEICSRIELHKRFSSISFKFGKFAQQINVFAQLRDIKHIKIQIYYFQDLVSFNDLIGINDINNIKTIIIEGHSFPFIDLQAVYNINHQIEYLEISSTNTNTSVKNMQFFSQMDSLKQVILTRNNLNSFDFDALKGSTNLRSIMIENNNFNYTLNTHCLDFEFLHNLPNLQELFLRKNQIECIANFMPIQKHLNLKWLDLQHNKISSLDFSGFQGTNLQQIDLSYNKIRSSNHDGDTSQLQPCFDFNTFNNMSQLQTLHLEFNQIECIINFESIQQHTQLEFLHLGSNHLLSSIDFTKFDESKPMMDGLHEIVFNNMTLKYTMHNDNCLDLQFLKFMPNIKELDFARNQIECVDNLSILQGKQVNLGYLYLDNNNLVSFDFVDLIGSNIEEIYLTNNNLSLESLKNFDINTLSRINPSGEVLIDITQGNPVKLQVMNIGNVLIF